MKMHDLQSQSRRQTPAETHEIRLFGFFAADIQRFAQVGIRGRQNLGLLLLRFLGFAVAMVFLFGHVDLRSRSPCGHRTGQSHRQAIRVARLAGAMILGKRQG